MGAADKVPELKRWYDGYRFGGKEIYNPWSVLNYFDNGCLPRTYWVNTSGNAILGEMLRHSHGQVLDKLQTVLQGGSLWTRVREGVIYKEIYKNEPALYTMLVTTGYLTVKSIQDSELGIRAELVLPNRELRSLFRIEILERYRSDDMGMEVDDLMRAFAAGDIETVREGLSRYLEVLTSSFDVAKGKEAFYHGLVLGLTAGSSPMGLYTLIDEKTIFAGALTSSSIPGGAVTFVEDHENPPSRAYLKIQESLSLAHFFFGVDFPKAGQKCFEAGACPGGWTWVLAELGSEILAVDRAELAPKLMKNPLVTFQAHDAFTLKPEDIGSFDWIFSDVICYPERLLDWVNMWLESGKVRNMICTIQMQGEIDYDLVSRFAQIPNSKVVHLNYNKHELTWLHHSA